MLTLREGHSFRFGFLALNCFNAHSLNMSWMSFFNLLLLLPTCFLLLFNFRSSRSRIFMISWYVCSWTVSSSAELFTSVSESFANLCCHTWQDIGKNMKHGGDDESNEMMREECGAWGDKGKGREEKRDMWPRGGGYEDPHRIRAMQGYIEHRSEAVLTQDWGQCSTAIYVYK